MNTLEFDPFKICLEELKGLNFIEASAGTGKTFCIENIFVRFLLDGYPSVLHENYENINIREILVVTFTNAATKELKSRIYKRIEEANDYLNSESIIEDSYDPLINYLKVKERDEKWKENAKRSIKLALLDFDEVNVFTIHSFCERILTENAFESGKSFSREINFDENKYIETAVEDFWRENVFILPAEVYSKLKDMSEHKDVKSFRIDLDVFKSLASNMVKIIGLESTNILPEIENCSNKETLFNKIKEVKGDKTVIKNDYEKEKIYIHNVINNEFDGDSASNIINTLDNYFYDEDRICYDEEKLVDLCEIHPVFERIKKLNNRSGDLVKSIDKDSIIYLRLKLLNNINKKIKQLKYKDKKITFTNQLIDLYEALQKKDSNNLLRKVKDRYKIAMIDEFQDTDQIQYDILKEIFIKKINDYDDKTIFFIGDPKQSIYKFRGVDIFVYLNAKKEAGTKIYTLIKNYRSSKKLISAFNVIFTNLKKPFIFDGIDYYELASGKEKFKTEGLVENIEIKYPNEEINKSAGANEAVCKDIVCEITKLLNSNILINSRALKADDISIMVYSNKEIDLLRGYLNRYGIPTVASSNKSVFDTEEAEELKKFLIAVSNPVNATALLASLTTSLFTKTAEDIYKLRMKEKEMTDLINEFLEYQRIWQNNGVFNMVTKLIQRNKLKEEFINRPGGSRKLVNFMHLTELLHKASNLGINKMYETIKWLDDAKNNSSSSIDEYLLRLESDDNAIHITTIHKSKGLEYPIVFFPFFWKEVKADSVDNATVFHKGNKIYLDVGSKNIDENSQKSALEKLAEDIRLFYVAITRAACKCYIYYYYNASRSGGHNTRPSAMHYIFHYGRYYDTINDVKEIKNHLKEELNSYTARIEDLKSLASSASDGSIVVNEMNQDVPQTCEINKEVLSEELINRKDVKIVTRPSYLVESYSHLVAQVHYNEEIYKFDELYNKEEIMIDKVNAQAEEDEEKINIFNFPAGAKAGSNFHKIMESLDFTLPKDRIFDVVKTDLSNVYSETYLSILADKIDDILKTNIGTFCGENLYLKDIDNSNKYAEVDFYLHLNDLKLFKDRLLKYFKHKNLNNFEQALEKLTFASIEGYLNGFIDLIFIHNKKYYIVDWKFNHLGNSYNDYSQENLLKVITNANYYLQYYIYLLALYEYLKYRIKNFNTHYIGGIFYIFVRGVQKENTSTGIYYDKPIDFLKDI
jgi:exodeoxyribonuclease V beta subunit